jgi:hypothetical protein
MGTAPVDPPSWDRRRIGSRGEKLFFDLLSDSRIMECLWFDGRLLTDFVLSHQVDRRGAWVDIVRVDCCDEEVHVHRFTRQGEETRKSLRVIRGPVDIKEGFDEAKGLIFDHWQSNERMWRRES